MKLFAVKKFLAAALSAAALSQPAHAVLQRVGPVDGAHGFPAWYQDANGVALEFCAPTAQADLIAGLCAILPGTPPAGLSTLPETFPGNFSLEHFYYLLTVDVPAAALDKKTGRPAAGAGRFVFVNGVEATFNTPVPEAGQQVTFNRWRVRMNAIACTGNYTFYTPSRAPKTVPGTAGGRIADTEDIGIGPTFDGALSGSAGPYVLRASTPAGTALPFVAGADGKQYLSAGDIGAVTGSVQPNPFKGSTLAYIPPEIRAMASTNYVMVVGPGVLSGNCATTEAVYALNQIQVLGRINTVPVASRSYVDRATYRALDSNADGVVDRFQIGAWASAMQEVGRPQPILALSLNKGDPGDAANSTPELAMIKLGVAQAAPAPGTVATPKFIYFNGVLQPTVAGRVSPAFTHARVRTTTDSPASMVNLPLVDELRVTAANYNANTRMLTITADSGALLVAASPSTQSAASAACSDPCLVLDSDGLPAADALGAPIDFKLTIAAGAKSSLATVAIPNVTTPPAFVTVRSSAGGMDRQQVMYLGSPAGTAVFQPDVASTQINLPVTVDVLANDVGVAATPNLLVCTAATGGTCGVPSATATCTVGTVSTSCTAQGGKLAIAGGKVVYTPRAKVGGLTDSFYYQAATVLGTTQRALAKVNVGLLNGLPDARDDLGHTTIVGKPLSIDVLANDFAFAGVDAATLRITAEPFNLTTGAPAPGAALFGGGKLLFTAPSAGNWSMAYTFTDKAGLTADQGVVTVNAIGAELVTVARARWTLPRAPNLGTLAVNGTVNVAQGQVLQLRQPNAATGAAGCNAPQLGTPLGEAIVAANGAFDFGALPMSAKPVAVYVYSPSFGGCTQATVQ
jgi:hypothetical protein